MGTETGKIRFVVIIQTNLLNKIHPSTIICPITTNVKASAKILRVQLKKCEANMNEDCDIMVDQIRAIDNKRLLRKVGELPKTHRDKLKENLKIVIDMD